MLHRHQALRPARDPGRGRSGIASTTRPALSPWLESLQHRGQHGGQRSGKEKARPLHRISSSVEVRKRPSPAPRGGLSLRRSSSWAGFRLSRRRAPRTVGSVLGAFCVGIGARGRGPVFRPPHAIAAARRRGVRPSSFISPVAAPSIDVGVVRIAGEHGQGQHERARSGDVHPNGAVRHDADVPATRARPSPVPRPVPRSPTPNLDSNRSRSLCVPRVDARAGVVDGHLSSIVAARPHPDGDGAAPR